MTLTIIITYKHDKYRYSRTVLYISYQFYVTVFGIDSEKARYTIESNIDNVIVFIIRSSRDVSTVPKTFSGVLLTTRQVLVTRQGNIGQVIPHLMV